MKLKKINKIKIVAAATKPLKKSLFLHHHNSSFSFFSNSPFFLLFCFFIPHLSFSFLHFSPALLLILPLFPSLLSYLLHSLSAFSYSYIPHLSLFTFHITSLPPSVKGSKLEFQNCLFFCPVAGLFIPLSP